MVDQQQLVDLVGQLILGPPAELQRVLRVKRVGDEDDSEVDLALMRPHVVLELLPLLLNMQMPADAAEGTGQPLEEPAEK